MQTLKSFFSSCQLPLLEAKMLAEKALNVERAWLIAHDTDIIASDKWQYLQQLAQRRLNGEPMAYIIGFREFMGLEFEVNPAVLIPRPDTEILVETALDFLKNHLREGSSFTYSLKNNPKENPSLTPTSSVLDLGTGSGAIAISLAYYASQIKVFASDISLKALTVAKHNAQKFNLKINFQHSNWFEQWQHHCFDLIVSNPPYIHKKDKHLHQGDLRFEPKIALTDFEDGLSCYRTLISQAPQHLTNGGGLFVEHGWDQADAVRQLLIESGFKQVHSVKDLAGIERVSGGVFYLH